MGVSPPDGLQGRCDSRAPLCQFTLFTYMLVSVVFPASCKMSQRYFSTRDLNRKNLWNIFFTGAFLLALHFHPKSTSRGCQCNHRMTSLWLSVPGYLLPQVVEGKEHRCHTDRVISSCAIMLKDACSHIAHAQRVTCFVCPKRL